MTDHFLYNKKYKRFISGQGWWRKRIIKRRIRVISKNINLKKGDKILEVGCDQGVMLRMFEKLGAVGYGIDINKEAVRLANHPRIFQGQAENLPFADKSFDFVITSHLIEHLHQPDEFLKEAVRVTKESGKIVLIYPLEFFPGMTIFFELLNSSRSLKKMKEIHPYCYTPKKIKKIIKETSLEHLKSHLFWGFPFMITLEYFTLLGVK